MAALDACKVRNELIVNISSIVHIRKILPSRGLYHALVLTKLSYPQRFSIIGKDKDLSAP